MRPIADCCQCFEVRWNCRQLCSILIGALVVLLHVGCSNDSDAVEGRVAVDVTVTINGESAGTGTLVLRPKPTVDCPMVRIPVVDGRGSLPETSGPVPGDYTASFRGEGGSLTDQLESQGRTDPDSQSGGSLRGSQTSGNTGPPKSLDVTVPDSNPATLELAMQR